MAHPMVSLSVCVLVLFMVVVVEAGPPKPKKVRCKDKKFDQCYKQDRYCPASCPRDCVVDCVSCNPVCTAPPPPPPSPPPPPPKQKKLSPPPRSPSPPKSKNRSPPPPRTPPPPTHIYIPPPPPPPPPPPTTTANQPPPHTPTYVPPPPPPTPTTSLPPSPTTPNSAPPLNPPPSTSPTEAYCKNRDYPHCYKMKLPCPSACADQCEVDCVTCSPVCDCNKPGAICQDPRFIGGDGISFYFHGKKDQDFCIVSDSNIHINAHFIGKRNQNMKRDFTWVKSLGILFDTHQLVVGAKKTSIWNDAYDRITLAFDGELLILPYGEGAVWNSTKTPSLSITRSRETNSVVIEVEGNFKIKATVVPITQKESRVHNYGITEEDCFAHLDLGFKFYSLSGNVNGVLGQTYGGNYVSRVKMGVVMPVLGGDKEFASSSLVSTDCAVARFNGHFSSPMNLEYGNLNCASGIAGGGVVCKR